jgi:hypothetical protein
MKKSKIKKLSKLIFEEIQSFQSQPVKLKNSFEESVCNYNPDVSAKFKKIILQLLNYSENLNISLSDDSISISCSDVTSLKNSNNKSKNFNDDNYIEIYIHKSDGFSVTYGYKWKSNYRDSELYDELKQIIEENIIEKNRKSFENIWEKLMLDSGLLRDNNLDEILNG